MELLQLAQIVVVVVQQVELEEGGGVHLVGRLEVAEEPDVQPVRKDADVGVTGVEVAEQLTVLGVTQVRGNRLRLDQILDAITDLCRVVDLLALLEADIGDIFRDNLRRIEHVKSEHAQERHHDGVLCCLFRLRDSLRANSALGQIGHIIFECHVFPQYRNTDSICFSGQEVITQHCHPC